MSFLPTREGTSLGENHALPNVIMLFIQRFSCLINLYSYNPF